MFTLALIKRFWPVAAVAALLAAFGIAYVWHGHTRYKAGIAAQQAADAKSLAIYTAARDKITANAEATYHAELASLAAPSVELGPVRLRLDVPRSADSCAAPGGSHAAVPAAGHVQPVYGGNSAVRQDLGPNIAGLLTALGKRADQVSAHGRALLNVAQ